MQNLVEEDLEREREKKNPGRLQHEALGHQILNSKFITLTASFVN